MSFDRYWEGKVTYYYKYYVATYACYIYATMYSKITLRDNR